MQVSLENLIKIKKKVCILNWGDNRDNITFWEIHILKLFRDVIKSTPALFGILAV